MLNDDILDSMYNDAIEINHLIQQSPIKEIISSIKSKLLYSEQIFILYAHNLSKDVRLISKAWQLFIKHVKENNYDLFNNLYQMMNHKNFSLIRRPKWPFMFFIYLWFNRDVPTKECMDYINDKLGCFSYMSIHNIFYMLHTDEPTYIIRFSTTKSETFVINYRSVVSRTVMNLRVPFDLLEEIMTYDCLYEGIFFVLLNHDIDETLNILLAIEPEWKEDEQINILLKSSLDNYELWLSIRKIYHLLRIETIQLVC